MIAIEAVTTTGATAALCQSVGLARALSASTARPVVDADPTRGLGARARARRTPGGARRVAQRAVGVARRSAGQLLEEQTYLCDVSHSRRRGGSPGAARPDVRETGARGTAPNQIWSWDIQLKGPIPYLSDSLYVILDLFSRYVVGWMVAAHENAHLAQRLIEATCRKQHIGPQQLTIHADRGAPMRSKLVALLFSDLGIEASHSRPRVSNDNPFSEAQFRTVKYRPDFPDRFGSIEHARAIGHDLFALQRRASPQWPELSHARRRPLWARGHDP